MINRNPLFIKIDMSIKRFMQRDLTVFFTNSLFFTGLLLIYSLGCSYLLPQGVNAHFASILLIVLSGIFLLFVLIFSGWRFLTRKMSYAYNKKYEPFKTADFIFILIPMTPVMQYILSNQDSLTMFSSSLIFIIFGVTIAIFGIVIPVLLSRFAFKKVLITASVSFLYMIMSMASLAAANGWSGKGIISIQIVILLIVILVLSLLRFIPEKIIIIAIVVFFTVNTVTGVLFKKSEGGESETVKNFSVMSALEGKRVKKHNDVLLIVYESYPNYETLKHYGFENSEQLAFLESNGFRIYNGVYSLGIPTEQSMSRVFNVELDLKEHKKYLAGGGAVHSILRGQGYKTYGVFDNSWNLRGLPIDQIKYDNCFPRPSGVMDSKVLVNAIFTGEFSDAVSFEGVDYNSYIDHKHKVIKKEYPCPVFMYSHSSFPGHGPSGMGMRLEEREGKIAGHLEGIQKANVEMKQDVDVIIKSNPDAIVVIAGDHGPFLTKTGYGLSKGRGGFSAEDIDRYDIQDRFGSFLAIRWPEKKYAEKYDIKVFQDIFPAIFSYLYDDDSIFNKIRIERVTREIKRILGVYVKDGVIYGGKDNGQKLFLMEQKK